MAEKGELRIIGITRASKKGELMNLYLIRHADALALGERGITEDAARPLSPRGENQARQVGKTLHKRGIARH